MNQNILSEHDRLNDRLGEDEIRKISELRQRVIDLRENETFIRATTPKNSAAQVDALRKNAQDIEDVEGEIEALRLPKYICGSGRGFLSLKISEAIKHLGATVENTVDAKGERIWRIVCPDYCAQTAATNPLAYAETTKARIRLIVQTAWNAAQGDDAEAMGGA